MVTNLQKTTGVEPRLRGMLRTIRDFPKPGIGFIDIMPLIADGEGLALAAAAMAAPFQDKNVTVVVGAESRGFILGAAVARELGAGFVAVRKPGKLPGKTIAEEYTLEYGTDRLEMHADAIRHGERVLMVDDLLATGGTMEACCKMVRSLGGEIVGVSFLVELAFLKGKEKLVGYDCHSVIVIDEE
ncbi:MAG: adenine phosphoribosyltransferase [Sedimentisphaerales bacterium]|nr:adenine phosphoribosyltransferase [Sedimentisphaerales bacterium]